MKDYIYTDHSKGRKRQKTSPLARVAVLALGGFIVFELGVMAMEIKARYGDSAEPRVVVEVLTEPTPPPPAAPPEPEMAKKDLAGLLGAGPFSADGQRIVSITDQEGNLLFFRTTLLPELQSQGDAWVKSSRAHQAALVVLNPDNGQVLTLAGFNENDELSNAALAGSFPAASVFKIVTAAAAVEKAEMSAESRLAYDGGKHTLFKNNVDKEPDQGRQTTTLKESFADSINSVFGKLGAFTLGPEELSDFAGRFGFNREIDFELPVEASSFSVDDNDTFHLAELASGFNRSTKVSPLHGALMASAVVAEGRVASPSLVQEVFDRENRIYYQAGLAETQEVMSPATAKEMTRMMRSAVEEGTGRRTFGSASTHPILSRLDIGGKSGTINNDLGQKVDWFVAWAKPRPGTGCEDKLALSAVVVHSGVTNTTSQRLVRDALVEYYKGRLVGNKKNQNSATAARAANGG